MPEILTVGVDYLCEEVFIGDTVIYANQSNSSGLRRGVVKKITPCGVTLESGLNRQSYQIVKIQKEVK